ncbi:MAG TPA: PRC-barrel domain-containing protein [Hyphomicrobiales bacterium]|nr:PRC-barrel domain-containing protein [Hyphomicrobiales bacterium]
MKLPLFTTAFFGALFAIAAYAADDSAFKEEQTSSEWRMATYLGSPIYSASGEKMGDVKDVLFDRTGKIQTVVIGVGGFLGLGEKRVAVPFEVVTYVDENDERRIIVPLTKEELQNAPAYKVSEKTTMEKVTETATEVAVKASKKAVELKDKAVEKYKEYQEEADQDDKAN